MDLSVLPTLYALLVFVLCFRPMVRRAGPHTNLWFVGWTFLLLHYAALLLPVGEGAGSLLRELLILWSVELCGLSFMWAASDAEHSNRILVLEIGVPILLQSGMYVFDIHAPWLRLAVILILLIPAVHTLALPKHRTLPSIHLATAFAIFALALVPFSKVEPFRILNLLLCALFLSAAYLSLAYAGKITRGTSLLIGGLFLWALSYPFRLTGLLESDVHLNRAIVDLPRFLVAAGMMISFLDEHVGRTEMLALHDPLTGLPNRRLFENRLHQAIKESMRTGVPVACLVIDVDNFKYINDTHGHSVGDGLLQALAKRLSWNLGSQDMLARTGGDEFTAILLEADDEFHIRFIAGAMMASGCVPVSIQNHSIDVRISIGVAVSPQDAGDGTELHKVADRAMYLAKGRGGSNVVFAGEDIPQIHAV